MSKVLVIAEHLDGTLNASATAKTVAAAQALSPLAIDVAVFAADPASAAADAATIAGVSKVLALANPANAQALAQVLGPQIAKLATGYSHVFAPSTTFGKDLMPVVAALLGVNQVSDLMTVEGSHTFKRPIYAGNAIITVEAPADQIVVATVRAASWPEAAQGGSSAQGADPSQAAPQQESTRSAARVETRTLGGVVADNVAAEAMIARDLPSGSTSGQASLGGREWRWVRVVSATDMPGVGRIDVRVFSDEEQAAERVLFRAAGA